MSVFQRTVRQPRHLLQRSVDGAVLMFLFVTCAVPFLVLAWARHYYGMVKGSGQSK